MPLNQIVSYVVVFAIGCIFGFTACSVSCAQPLSHVGSSTMRNRRDWQGTLVLWAIFLFMLLMVILPFVVVWALLPD